MTRIGIILVALTLYGQEPPAPSKSTSGAKFVASFSHQPLETFKSAFLSKVQNIALYEATVCNVGIEPGTISGGVVLQAAQKKVPTVNTQLVTATLSRARKKSNMFKIMRLVEWAAFAGAILTTGKTFNVPDQVKQIFPIIASTSDKLSTSFAEAGIDPAALGNWVRPESMTTLMPQQCSSGLFLGGWSKGHMFETFITVLGDLEVPGEKNASRTQK